MYLVKFADNTEISIEIRQSPKRRGRWEAILPNGDIISMTMKGRDDNDRYVIAIDNTDVEIALIQKDDNYILATDTYHETLSVSRAAEVVFEEIKVIKEKPSKEKTLVSPITGIVLKTFVTQGDTVPKDSPVILIEAMKMENTLYATDNQIVEECHVKAGDTVFVGDPLITYK